MHNTELLQTWKWTENDGEEMEKPDWRLENSSKSQEGSKRNVTPKAVSHSHDCPGHPYLRQRE